MQFALKVACCIGFADALRVGGKVSANVTGNVITTRNQQFKVFTPTAQGTSCDAVLFGVGTATGVNGYDRMAEALTGKGFVVAIVDPEKGWFTKNNVGKLREAFAFAQDNLVSWSDGTCSSVRSWILGGHSAGGGTTHKVVSLNPSMADGIFSWDPFTNSGLRDYTVSVPGLYWGLDTTTCAVTKKDAAEAYYELTETKKRILVRIYSKEQSANWCANHCSIVDGGCIVCQPCMPTPQYFFDDVAESVHAFSRALGRSDFLGLTLKLTTPNDNFVADDL